jgi:hypothetical protein
MVVKNRIFSTLTKILREQYPAKSKDFIHNLLVGITEGTIETGILLSIMGQMVDESDE